MKKWFYASDYNESKSVPATKESALADVADIGRELARYGGRLGDFAGSLEKIDQMEAQGLRAQCSILAWNVVLGDLSEEVITEVKDALKAVCANDPYAVKELAGRFGSGVKRIRVLIALAHHPRAARFSSLREAIERGRFTANQWALAQKLAAEVTIKKGA